MVITILFNIARAGENLTIVPADGEFRYPTPASENQTDVLETSSQSLAKSFQTLTETVIDVVKS